MKSGWDGSADSLKNPTTNGAGKGDYESIRVDILRSDKLEMKLIFSYVRFLVQREVLLDLAVLIDVS